MIDPDFNIYYMTAMEGWRLAKVNWLDCSGYDSRVSTFAKPKPFIKLGKLQD